jgi:E-phenylitaconyl-CoA hydratase
MTSSVIVEQRQRVLVITLNRPERLNALDWDGWEALSDAWHRLISDDDVWVGVVTAVGDAAFSTGADLKSLPQQIAQRRSQGDRDPFPRMAFRDVPCHKPVVASINGDAIGGGLELALSCDLRVCSDSARFGLPEAKWGGLPGAGGTQRLPRSIAPAVAMELMLTGRLMSADEAQRVGLVNRAVTAADLRMVTDELVEQLLAMSPLALRAIKRAALSGADLPLIEGLRLEREVTGEVMESQDYANSISAFAERRRPEWTGR